MNFYKNLVAQYYSQGNLEILEAGTHEYYNNAQVDKIKYTNRWHTFVNIIEDEDLVITKTRDYSFLSRTHFFLAVGIEGNKEGLTININLLAKLIGFNFCKYEIESNYMNGSGVANDLRNSYFPLSNVAEEFMKRCVMICEDYFPEFEIFNNFFASMQAKDVIVDLGIRKEIDYFKLFFYEDLLVIA